MYQGERGADMKLSKTKSGGLRFDKSNQQGKNFDWSEYNESGVIWLNLAIPYQKKYTGGEFEIVGMVAPIDADNMLVFFWRCKKVQGWERDLWRFMYKNRLEGNHWAVLEQDRVVLENMAPNARDHEFLYQHDMGLSRLRRMLEKQAKKQVEALQAWHEVRAQDAEAQARDHA